jgi:hypothetical protein
VKLINIKLRKIFSKLKQKYSMDKPEATQPTIHTMVLLDFEEVHYVPPYNIIYDFW